MTQEQYNDIVTAIQFGMPAKAAELTNAFNNLISLVTPNKPEVAEAPKQNEVKETE